MSRFIPPETKRKQLDASDPRTSAWVSANAGSGKTYVLAQRVIRLLLEDIEPSRILCLTYTRVAAANMSNTVFKQLSEWALMTDADLDKAISATGTEATPQKRSLARKLFARALETPGGLKIQTIHAFCEAVLHQFPLEANIAGHFELLDSEMEIALVAEARRDMIAGASAGESRILAEAFADVLERVGEDGLDRLLGEIVRRRSGLRTFTGEITDGDRNYRPLFEEFGFDAADTEGAVARNFWPIPGMEPAYFSAFAEAARAVGAANVERWILEDGEAGFAEADPASRLSLLARGFLKSSGEPYGPKTFPRALVARLPDVVERYERAAAHIAAATDRLATFRMISATRSALTIADWLIGRYERLKSARGFLDFNDLIERTATLFARADVGPWVHYKLDQGIDHILIDEAQDTSPSQWEVVRKLASEFFVGLGARDGRTRTIFAVGDEKQSIYSFQGADPRAFAETGAAFGAEVQAADASFRSVRLTQSFRSTRDVLSAVDLVFSDPSARAGLQRDDIPLRHEGIREGEGGCVEVWASLGPDAVDEPDDWTTPVDQASAPAVRLAGVIARTIADWIARGEVIEEENPRPVRPGDVLVLVRKRDAFVHALTRALKQPDTNVPVAGADRLLLTDHIAVKDLIALARFSQQPQDDLSLAALLRSPIFGWTDEQLFSIAHGRGKRSLFDALRDSADFWARGVIAELEDWRNQAAFRPPFEFFAGVLAGTPERSGVRARLLARLGEEAGDIIDEFLSFCLAVEQSGSTGLEVLLATLDTASPEIKRELEHGRDEVRILTAHAAKGLEAPIVFLVDPGSRPFHDSHLPTLLPLRSSAGNWQGEGYIWQPRKDLANQAAAAVKALIRASAEAEYRRLLYVGMTRAKDRLIVCGYHGANGPPGDGWHSMAVRAISGSPDAAPLDAPAECLPAWRYRVSEHAAPAAMPGIAANKPVQPAALELKPLPEAYEPPPPLRPSGAGLAVEAHDAAPERHSPVLDEELAGAMALARGTAMHRLLQALPDVASGQRHDAARRYVEAIGHTWPEHEREAMLASVSQLLDDRRFAPIFSANSRAEVQVMGTVEIGGAKRSVSGKIDRLAVTAEAVTIVDFKTGRAPEGDAAPFEHLAQVALYRALLAPLYPDRHIETALIYTAGPTLVVPSVSEMEEALARLARS